MVEGGRRQEVFFQKGIQTPPEKEPQNKKIWSSCLKPKTIVVTAVTERRRSRSASGAVFLQQELPSASNILDNLFVENSLRSN
ncbi:hypothetical protein CDG77_22090 [Nostoc sp. 'Peltigera membranacea cyanobiont' 213]|nr:hypothetical protein CDG77_22090 [Nostoc sp. 'Peltigera membranacea cyanobiont' 213]